MTYKRLCLLNKELYAALETNTLELQMNDEIYHEKAYNQLLDQCSAIKQEIEDNMLILDEFLFGTKIMRPAHRRAHPGKTNKIIEAFAKSPSTPIQKLAEGLNVSKDTFSRTITAHLAKKYG